MSRFKKFPVQKPGANDFIFCTKHSDTNQFCKKSLYILRSRRNSKTPARQGKIVENKQKHLAIPPNAWLFWASWGGRGRWFKSSHSDQKRRSYDLRFSLLFAVFIVFAHFSRSDLQGAIFAFSAPKSWQNRLGTYFGTYAADFTNLFSYYPPTLFSGVNMIASTTVFVNRIGCHI